jgi:hypothetical protein
MGRYIDHLVYRVVAWAAVPAFGALLSNLGVVGGAA